MKKYGKGYSEKNATLWKLWHEDKAGGESGLFTTDRTISNKLNYKLNLERNLIIEAYFKIFNIKVEKNVYADIWLFNSKVESQSDLDILEHINKRSQH